MKVIIFENITYRAIFKIMFFRPFTRFNFSPFSHKSDSFCLLHPITHKLDQLETSINTRNNINTMQFHSDRPTRPYCSSPRQRTSFRSPTRRSTSPACRCSPSLGKRCSFCGGRWHSVLLKQLSGERQNLL